MKIKRCWNCVPQNILNMLIKVTLFSFFPSLYHFKDSYALMIQKVLKSENLLSSQVFFEFIGGKYLFSSRLILPRVCLYHSVTKQQMQYYYFAVLLAETKRTLKCN